MKMLAESVFPLRIVSFPIHFVSFALKKAGFPGGSVRNSTFPSAECQVFPKSAWMSGKAESLLREILEALGTPENLETRGSRKPAILMDWITLW